MKRMSGRGGALAAIRRVPLLVTWAVLSASWMLLLRTFWADDPKPWEYVQTPLYLGVMLIASRLLSKRHQTWGPPLIGLAVSVPVVLIWKALS
jgi:hypothetical protein